MTTILAIDTSTPACSVAIRSGDEVLSRYQLASREHTKLLLPMVDDLLSEAALTLSQLDAIAFTAGPGSFTGIRIGFGVVQGLAFGAELPVLPISSLETLAQTAVRKLRLDDEGAANINILPMLDARMDEVYWGQFQLFDGVSLHRTCDDSLTAPEGISIIDGDLPTVIVGDGWNYAERIPLQASMVDKSLLPDAQDVLTLAVPLFMTGKALSVEQVSPVYLRDTITWKKRKRLR